MSPTRVDFDRDCWRCGAETLELDVKGRRLCSLCLFQLAANDFSGGIPKPMAFFLGTTTEGKPYLVGGKLEPAHCWRCEVAIVPTALLDDLGLCPACIAAMRD